MKIKFLLSIQLLIYLCFCLTVFASSDSAVAKVTKIEFTEFDTYSSEIIYINVGDTVRWTWGSGTHNLRTTSGVESFNSDFQSTEGFQYMYQFNQVGATQYVCDPHPSTMFGTITVID